MSTRIRQYLATEKAWVRRRDIGPNVWERPDGSLYAHKDGSEPVITIIDCAWISYRTRPPTYPEGDRYITK